MTTKLDSFLALILSALLPGLGQLYNQEPKKGALILTSSVILAILGFTFFLALFFEAAVTAWLALLLLWVSAIVDAYKVGKDAGRVEEFYYTKSYVVAMLLLVGPLALPLLWQSPNFSNSARWIWTVIVSGAALMFIATPYLLKPLIS